MLALAVLDLPFEAAKHTTKADNGQFTFTAGGPCHFVSQGDQTRRDRKQRAGPASRLAELLSAWRPLPAGREREVRKIRHHRVPHRRDVWREHRRHESDQQSREGRRAAADPAGRAARAWRQSHELASGASGALHDADLRVSLLLPARSGEGRDEVRALPRERRHRHRFSAAKPFEFNVVAKLTEVDKASWDYVSQNGTDADVFTFLEQNNLEALNLERIAWRCRQRRLLPEARRLHESASCRGRCRFQLRLPPQRRLDTRPDFEGRRKLRPLLRQQAAHHRAHRAAQLRAPRILPARQSTRASCRQRVARRESSGAGGIHASSSASWPSNRSSMPWTA
jgi:hypothetical protein